MTKTTIALGFAFGLAALAACDTAPVETAAAQTEEARDRFPGIEARMIGPWRGGRVTAVAGVLGDPLTYYAGATGGLMKTTNAGATWEIVSDEDFKTAPVGAVAVAPSDPNVIVVGMGESPFRGVASSQGDGVYISTDAGATFEHKGLEATRQIGKVRIHPTNPDVIWLAAQGDIWEPTPDRGVYKSVDGGESWEKVLEGENETTGAVDLSLDPNNPRILYAAMWDHQRLPWEIRSGGPGSGVWRSKDGGASWEELSEGLPEEMGKIGVAAGATDGLVWAVVEAKEKGGLYKSTDFGESWTHVNGDRDLHQRSWYYMHVYADPADPNRVYVHSAPFMASIDGGKSFSQISGPHGDHHALWINPDDPMNMIDGNDGGATVTFDGGKSWTTIYNQPTAQMYRVNVDNAFFYRVYGGQQDNSTVGILGRAPDGSIGPEDYMAVGGCESGHVAFNPDDVRHVYAGCYLGILNEFDMETGTTRSVEAYPELAFGVNPGERKYRFNWNAPIVVSAHDDGVVYHAGNHVLRTRDRGVSWEEISPDLTRDEDDKQGPMGGPITNEVTENYNTILALTEDPTDPDVLWAGTDDGLVHVTRDGGESWVEVTPRGVGERMVNAIDISPHDSNTVYLAVTGYKLGDDRPYVFRTTNGGEAWTRIDRDLPADEFVRVVRADPVREGLLFAGTERGLWVSFNDGQEWEKLDLGLPAVPVTDIKITERDLVLSTQGRSFWVIDDLSPFRTLDPRSGEAALLPPADAYRVDYSSGVRGGPTSPNPPTGALIHYRLNETPDLKETVLKLDILDEDGDVVRTLKSDEKKGEDGGGAGASYALPAHAGVNRARWDLTAEPIHMVKGLTTLTAGPDGKVPGRIMGPGRYRARLTLGEETVGEEAFEVVWNPHLKVDPSLIARQQSVMAEADAMLDELMRSIASLRAVKAQAEERKAYLEETKGEEALIEAATTLIEAVTEWEASVVSAEREGFQDALNWPDKLASDLQWIRAWWADGQHLGLTRGVEDRFNDVKADFAEAMTARDAVVRGALADYQKAFADEPPLAVRSFVKAAD